MRRVPSLLLLPFLLCALAAPAWACLWYYGKNAKGEEVKVGGLYGDPKRFLVYLTHNSEHDDALGTDTSKEPGPEADFRTRSDYAATLIHQGKAAKALPILEALEHAHPKEYILAVNLGTAYELQGEDEKALSWIQEGIRRNPDSHQGTEWLHVLILEAKIAVSKDPDWAKTHSVLGLEFGSGDVPVMPARFPSDRSPDNVRKALAYQLHERLAFIHPPDPLVAGMIADLANLEGLLETADHAAALYELALTYQPAHPELLLRRKAQALQYAGQIVSQQQLEQKRIHVAFGVAGLLIVGAIILYIVQKRRRSTLALPTDR